MREAEGSKHRKTTKEKVRERRNCTEKGKYRLRTKNEYSEQKYNMNEKMWKRNDRNLGR